MSMKEVDGCLVYDNWIEAQTARVAAWEAKGAGATAFPLSFYANELFGECGEAANVIKKLDREYGGAPGSRDTREHLGEELADGLICLRNLAVKMAFAERLLKRTVVVETRNCRTLSDWGNAIGYAVGEVCRSVMYSRNGVPAEEGTAAIDFLAGRVGFLQTVLYQAAVASSIQLDDVMQKKWNETSLKVGLPHRMNLSYSLEETFK